MTPGIGKPVFEPTMVMVPLIRLMIVAANKPIGTIFSLEVSMGPLKRKAPIPKIIPMNNNPQGMLIRLAAAKGPTALATLFDPWAKPWYIQVMITNHDNRSW